MAEWGDRPVITRIVIDHDDPKATLAVLRKWLDSTTTLPLGLNQTLMDGRPFSVGSVITYQRTPEVKREWK
jgi:hypothetical protein